MSDSGNSRTVEGAGACWYRHPDGSERMALLGDAVTVADSDVERFDRFNVAPVVVPLPSANTKSGSLLDDDLDADVPVVPEPPRAGAGASRVAWVAYAAGRGITLDEDATRDQIIAAVDALNH